MTMQIDTAHFPFVWIKMAAFRRETEVSPFAEFEALLARKEEFVLLNDEDIVKGKHEHSPEELKQTTRWMKAHKKELREFVKASIHIEPNKVKRAAAKSFSIIYEKFWGYPLVIVTSKEEALTIAHQFLSSQ